MKLIPLKQWICDACGEVIEKPEDGYVQFSHDEENNYDYKDFIIVHHLSVSPRRGYDKNGCYRYNADLPLEEMLGIDGLARLLSFIDVGYHIDHDFNGPKTKVKSLRKWADFVRRLQIPYYEEARLYWDKAEKDGFFDGNNEYRPYMQDKLQDLIEKYGE